MIFCLPMYNLNHCNHDAKLSDHLILNFQFSILNCAKRKTSALSILNCQLSIARSAHQFSIARSAHQFSNITCAKRIPLNSQFSILNSQFHVKRMTIRFTWFPLSSRLPRSLTPRILNHLLTGWNSPYRSRFRYCTLPSSTLK